MADQGQAGHRGEVVVELFDDQLAHECRLWNTEIDTLDQLTLRVIGRQDQPCHSRQSHQRLAAIRVLAGHGFRYLLSPVQRATSESFGER